MKKSLKPARIVDLKRVGLYTVTSEETGAAVFLGEIVAYSHTSTQGRVMYHHLRLLPGHPRREVNLKDEHVRRITI